VVLDEADEMLSMGFIDDVETILEHITVPHQTALFSATMPQRIVELSQKHLFEPIEVHIEADHLTVESIDQRYYVINQKDKIAALTRLFEVEDISSALIFTKTRVLTGEVANELSQRGYPAEAISGDLSQDARNQVLERFKNKQIKVLVATDVAARGLDIQGISHVINYDLPYEEEAYVHRIGRTARAGKSGIAITLVTPKEEYRINRLKRFINAPIYQFPIPTKEEIVAHRNQTLMDELGKWLARERCKQELKMVEELVSEGNDPMMVAAVALKLARAQERQRPIWDISEAKAPPASRKRDDKKKRREPRTDKSAPDEPISKESHEAGMVRLQLSVGKNHNARPRDVVGILAYQADIPGSDIGKIFISKNYTLVDVPEKHVPAVLGKSGKIKLHKYPVEITK
jgi:ATP-dependent RNA helicase DeaD